MGFEFCFSIAKTVSVLFSDGKEYFSKPRKSSGGNIFACRSCKRSLYIHQRHM